MHLETVIGQVRVPQEHRRAFLGQAAAAMLAALGVGLTQGCDRVPVEDGMRPEKPLVIPLEPLTPEKIEEHVKEVIANRFKVELDMVKPKAALLDLLHAGVGRVSDPPVVVAGEIARLPDDYHLLRLKRQLEKEYAIKLDGEDFFAKVKTVGDLVQAVQAAVKNRSQPSKEEPTPQRDRPISHGIRPIE
jgi:acyl carrier protein